MTDRELLEQIKTLIETTVDDSEELPVMILDMIAKHLEGGGQ